MTPAGRRLLRLAWVPALLMALAWLGPSLRQSDFTPGRIRMAAPTGAPEELIRLLEAHLRVQRPDLSLERGPSGGLVDLMQVRDCCAATAPWGLGGGSLDAAVMCPDAAAELVGRNKDFVLVGTVLLNGDVFVELPGASASAQTGPLRVGVSQGRSRQPAMVAARYGAQASVHPMPPQALMYALHNKQVDVAVIDVALAREAQLGILAPSGELLPTQVLVARKDFTNSEGWRDFLRAYDSARHELGQRYAPWGVSAPLIPYTSEVDDE